ncbi:hypothetical protein BO71DRAFT_485549 [Aspergillus ellipticus CBS 707.79]|uniref:Xylanolytic transcriptional activator regulatory domain-containing protein n=1 Tax=Aspergillus ellipticus CBS 707.79 TaxID=1448320 RepID=A0A319D4V6_9EURO|nr:hypothetical protein BO71DRAFT_485549 [Aspergillus ellipticus CBS 707.79]
MNINPHIHSGSLPMSSKTDNPAVSIQRSRIGRACEACRARKIKCNGITCVYRLSSRAPRRRHPVILAQPGHPIKKHRGIPNTAAEKASHRLRYDPAQLKKQMELRAGIGVSNTKTGSFQFYGPSSHLTFMQRVKEKGDAFIEAYFKLIHPMMPILSRSDIISTWDAYWDIPGPEKDFSSKEIIYMVLALGARVSQPTNGETPESLEKWAGHFSSQTNDFSVLFQEPGFKGLQFLLLKAMDAQEAMRPNDAYLLLGHAARSALTLGINKSQVANGNSFSMHRLRMTFWIIYAQERMSAWFTGRPSCLSDDHIDISFPEDLPLLENLGDQENQGKEVFSMKSIKSLESILNVERAMLECDETLNAITQSLPSFLHFFDSTSPIGEDWQEIQRTHLGMNYNLIRMVMHRPALIYSTFCASKTEAQSSISGQMSVANSINTAIAAAKDIITLASDVFFRRFPDIRNGASVAAFLISACITLLYDVLGSGAEIEYAKDILGYVDTGINCLDQMEHVGPTTGKMLSMDIMKCAKEALNSSSEELQDFGNLLNEFPWLSQSFFSPTADPATTIPLTKIPLSFNLIQITLHIG